MREVLSVRLAICLTTDIMQHYEENDHNKDSHQHKVINHSGTNGDHLLSLQQKINREQQKAQDTPSNAYQSNSQDQVRIQNEALLKIVPIEVHHESSVGGQGDYKLLDMTSSQQEASYEKERGRNEELSSMIESQSDVKKFALEHQVSIQSEPNKDNNSPHKKSQTGSLQKLEDIIQEDSILHQNEKQNHVHRMPNSLTLASNINSSQEGNLLHDKDDAHEELLIAQTEAVRHEEPFRKQDTKHIKEVSHQQNKSLVECDGASVVCDKILQLLSSKQHGGQLDFNKQYIEKLEANNQDEIRANSKEDDNFTHEMDTRENNKTGRIQRRHELYQHRADLYTFPISTTNAAWGSEIFPNAEGNQSSSSSFDNKSVKAITDEKHKEERLSADPSMQENQVDNSPLDVFHKQPLYNESYNSTNILFHGQVTKENYNPVNLALQEINDIIIKTLSKPELITREEPEDYMKTIVENKEIKYSK
jgi:hypothetical protein